MTNLNLQHWRLDTDAEGITWAILDKAGESANSLSRAVMDELGKMLDEFERKPPKALIFRSGKSAGFIAGADIQNSRNSIAPKKAANLSSAAGTCSTAWPQCVIRRWRWSAVTASVAASNWRWRAAICWR